MRINLDGTPDIVYSNDPAPEHCRGRTPVKRDFILKVLEGMPVGKSFLFDSEYATPQYVRKVHEKSKEIWPERKYTTRLVDGSLKIWRLK